MRESKGNMYDWVSHTWNPIKGICSHDCVYCYMKKFPQKPIRLEEKELLENLGEGNTIFVGSSTDMWAKDVPDEWIKKVLAKCRNFEGNTYLFQTKSPHRFWKFSGEFPRNTIFGTTLETNRDTVEYSKADPYSRASNMQEGFMERKMVTIEPIMDFDLEPFVEMIKAIKPEWVNIGADSKNHNLPEPSRGKVDALIIELLKFTEIKKKHNLNRLVPLTEPKTEVTNGLPPTDESVGIRPTTL